MNEPDEHLTAERREGEVEVERGRRAATQCAARQSGQPLQTARRNQRDVDPAFLHRPTRQPN